MDREREISTDKKGRNETDMHLVPLILQHLLNRDVGSILRTTGELCLENNTEGAVSDDLAIGVGDVSCFAGLSIRSDNFDNLPGVINSCKQTGEWIGQT